MLIKRAWIIYIIKTSQYYLCYWNFFFFFGISTANSNEGSLVLGKLEGNSEIESFSSPKVYGDFAGVTGKWQENKFILNMISFFNFSIYIKIP